MVWILRPGCVFGSKSRPRTVIYVHGFYPNFEAKKQQKNSYFMLYMNYKAVRPNPNFTMATHPTQQPFFISSSSSHTFCGCSSNPLHPLTMPFWYGTSIAGLSAKELVVGIPTYRPQQFYRWSLHPCYNYLQHSWMQSLHVGPDAS